MSKLLVVFGATGQQGGSVVDYVLNDPELSKQFKVRVVTRDPSGSSGKNLEKKGVEVVKGDAADVESIKAALKGAHTVFSMTNTIYERNGGKEREVQQGKDIADAAVAAGVHALIWSSIPSVTILSNGKNKNVPHFDSKAEVEAYIRTLPIRAAYYAPASFMQNFDTYMAPHPAGDGTFTIFDIMNPDTPIPFIDIVADTGKFVGAILSEPEKFNGKFLAAGERCYTMPEAAELISKVTGKTVTYKQISDEAMQGFFSKDFDVELLGMMQHVRDNLYYGPNTVVDVEQTAKFARGKLISLEEYLQKNPPKLD